MSDPWVIVTGASGGIGSAVVRWLAASGYAGTGVDLSWPDRGLDDVPGWESVQTDVSDEESVQRLIESLKSRSQSPPWGLVNAAAILGQRIPLLDVTLAEWNRVFAVNAAGTFLMTREVARWMRSYQRPGSIVTIASQLASVVSDNEGHYAASKAAVRHMTRAFASELAKTGIRVNSVSPGVVMTPMLEDRPADPAWRSNILARTPMGRIAEPEEIVPAVQFCLDERSSYLTGADIVIDGGWVLN